MTRRRLERDSRAPSNVRPGIRERSRLDDPAPDRVGESTPGVPGDIWSLVTARGSPATGGSLKAGGVPTVE